MKTYVITKRTKTNNVLLETVKMHNVIEARKYAVQKYFKSLNIMNCEQLWVGTESAYKTYINGGI